MHDVAAIFALLIVACVVAVLVIGWRRSAGRGGGAEMAPQRRLRRSMGTPGEAPAGMCKQASIGTCFWSMLAS